MQGKFQTAALCSLFAATAAYLTFHIFSGELGLFALMQLDSELKKKQSELEALQAEKFKLEHKVERMRDNSLDLDLLEEQARKVLGYAKPNEYIVILPQTPRTTDHPTEAPPPAQ